MTKDVKLFYQQIVMEKKIKIFRKLAKKKKQTNLKKWLKKIEKTLSDE